MAKLKSGSKFEDLAKQSKDPGSAENGGLLDWAPATNYVPPFADALKAMKKGDTTTTAVKTQYGFHVIRLEDSRNIQFPPLDEIKSKIVQTLQRKKLEAYQDGLRNKAKVQ
jgi:peptidyl-prolyl cis-trans isomerase C